MECIVCCCYILVVIDPQNSILQHMNYSSNLNTAVFCLTLHVDLCSRCYKNGISLVWSGPGAVLKAPNNALAVVPCTNFMSVLKGNLILSFLKLPKGMVAVSVSQCS